MSSSYKAVSSRAEASTPLTSAAPAASGGLLASKASIAAAALVAVAVVATAVALSVRPASSGSPAAPSLTAVARISNGTISGSVTFTQNPAGGPVTIVVAIVGGSAITDGQHGLHVHQNPSLGNGCNDAGAHFNPALVVHGGPTDAIRHVGDLGNAVAAGGAISYTFSDSVISLRPADANCIVNRAIMLHDWVDDYGKGASTNSTCGRYGNSTCSSSTTGNAGARIACAVIQAALSGALRGGGA